MVFVWVLIAVVALVLVGWAYTVISGGTNLDRLRRSDPEGAARLAARQAEAQLRSRSSGGTGGTTGWGGGSGF